MRLSLRLAVLGLLALFAGASLVGPAGAAAATASLALAEHAAPGAGGCDGCPGDPESGKAPCDDVCLAPFAAILATGGFAAPTTVATVVVPAGAAEQGRTGPPEPGPPRPLILR